MNVTEYLESLDAPLTTFLDLDGLGVRVDVNDERVHDGVRRYFAPFITPNESFEIRIVGIQGKPEFDTNALLDVPRPTSLPKAAFYRAGETLVIYKKRSGVVDYVHGSSFFVVGDLLRYAQQLFNIVGLAFLHSLRTRGWASIHASAVALDGQGIAFAGPSGSCKSTTGLAMLEQGYDFVSNDRVCLERFEDGTSMAGVPKWPRVNPGTLLAMDHLTGLVSDEDMLRYRAIPPTDLWSLEEKHDVPVDRIYGRKRLALRTRLQALYVLSWTRDGEPFQVKPVPEDQVGYLLLPLVKTELTDPPNLAQPTTQALSEVLKGVQVFQVTGAFDVEGLANRAVQAHGIKPLAAAG